MIAIVGGGVAGLAAAHEVRRQDPSAQLVVLEAAARAGGLLESERVGEWLCEWAAASFLEDGADDWGAIELCRELGVEVVVAAPTAKARWIFSRGRLRLVPASPLGLLRSDLLSIAGKLRLLREPWAKARPDGDDESVAAFARRRLGDEAALVLVAPAVLGIFAGDAERLSLAAAFPRVARLEREHGGLFAGLRAGRRKRAGRGAAHSVAPLAGAAALPEALAARLGGAVRTHARVVALELGAGQTAVVLDGGERIEATRIALALPPGAAATLLAPHDARLAELAGEITAADVLVVQVGFRRDDVPHRLDGFGFLVADGEAPRCLGCVFESSLWPARAPEGQVLLRLIYGGVRDPAALALAEDDAALAARVAQDLRLALGVIVAPTLLHHRRLARAIPQAEVGHLARVAEAETRAAALGVVLAGNAWHGVAVNDCVRDARRVADALLAGRSA